MSKTVACIVDIASRAAEMSGDVFSLTAQRETLDGVEHVRLVTDPVSMLLPLSAFRHVVAWTGAADQKLAKLAFSFWQDSEEETAKLLRLLADVREYEAQVPLDHVAAATGYRAGYVQGFANALTKTTNALHHLRIPAEHEVRYPYGEPHSPNQAVAPGHNGGSEQ